MAKSKTRSNQRPGTAKSLRSRPKKGLSRVARSRRGATKHDRVLGMLQSKGGTTIAAIVRVTGWQPHSVRGFLAGVVKKKLRLGLTSERTSSGRVYRVELTKPRPANRSETAAETAHA